MRIINFFFVAIFFCVSLYFDAYASSEGYPKLANDGQSFREDNPGKTPTPQQKINKAVPLYNGPTTFSEDFFDKFLLVNSFESLIETYYEPAYNQLLSTGDFSFPDNYVFSFLGNSWLWNKYYWNGVAITDSFFSGKTYHKLPIIGNELVLDPITGSFSQNTKINKNILYGDLTIGGLGQHVPFYNFFFDTYTQQSPQVTSNPPSVTKNVPFAFKSFYRKIFPLSASPLSVDSADYEASDQANLYISDIFVNIQARDFLTFDHNGYTGDTARESNVNLSWNNEIYLDQGLLGWIFSFQNRGNLFSEFYYSPEESANYNQLALTFYYQQELLLEQNYSLTLAAKSIKQNGSFINRNLFDITGEGLNPFYPSINTLEITQNTDLNYSFDILYQDFLKIASSLNNNYTFIDPLRRNYTSATHFRPPDLNDALALYVSNWESGQVNYLLYDNSIALLLNEVKGEKFQIEGSLGLDVDGFSVINEENLLRLSPSFILAMNILNDRWNFLRIEVGRVNIPFDSQYTTFLADNYHSAENYVWNDANNDLVYSAGEASSTLHSTTGSKYHSISEDFSQPHYYYIDVPYNHNFHTSNDILPFVLFGTSLHYRIFKDQAWVRPASGNQGSYEEVDGQSVYFPAYGEKNYVIENLSSSLFPESNRNWFNDSPMYLGASIKLALEGINFFFSVSFTAYLINGITSLGNGPLHNSLGIISELQGDPNQDFRSLGRLDPDRSYIGKILLNYWPTDDFVVTANLKYQDGQPIGKWGYHLNSNAGETSLAFLRENVSGDNLFLYNGEFGTREDALWIFDLKFLFLFTVYEEQDLSLYVNFYNLLDVGRSLLEYTFFKPNEENRDVIEIQIPRGIQIGLKLRY